MQPRDIRNLAESYQSIYANQETLIEEMESGQHPDKSSSEKTRIKYETEKRRNSAPTGTGVPDKKTGYQGLKDSTDYYTLIKGHLIDEGFASSEENAEKIISVMSENWIDSIIEGDRNPRIAQNVGIVGPPQKAIDRIPFVRDARIAISNQEKGTTDKMAGKKPGKVGKHTVFSNLTSTKLNDGSVTSPNTQYTDISPDRKR